MAPELVSHLQSRFVFVLGKGGVGKSTTSSALALALADAGVRTHLLSTDPAHSLRDLLGEPGSSGDSWTSECTPLLTVEELDAARHARQWLHDLRDPVGDLVERGTYLDREDVATLFDGSLPGMDEVMAALRIAELEAGSEHDRVVVDTAPTGHTLRLLGAGHPLSGWVDAVEAMADKASAVALALTGRRVAFEGEELVRRLDSEVDRFEKLLCGADFVVVTRDGDVVAAETRRLVERLRTSGFRLRATVAVAEAAAEDEPVDADADGTVTFHVPWRDDLVGCAGLRKWGEPWSSAAEARRPRSEARPRSNPLELLPPRSMMFFSGKGGVGKTTCAAAYAVALSQQRHRVLLLSTDPAGSLGDVFGVPIGEDGTRLDTHLTARQLDAEAAFGRFREAHRERVRAVFEGLGLRESVALDRRVLESLMGVAPAGLDEIFAVEAILDDAEDRDVLLLDTAPTGHFLRLLEMPRIALAWTRTLLRILLKYRALLGLDDFAEDVLQLAKRLGRLIALLGNPERSGVVIVTLGHELAVRETNRLAKRIRDGGVPVSAVIQNRWSPPVATVGLDQAAGEGRPVTILSPFVSPPPTGAERLHDLVMGWHAA